MFFFNSKSANKYIFFNRFFFNNQFKYKTDQEVLIEFNSWPVRNIVNSYLAYVLSQKFRAKIKSYPGYDLLLHKSHLRLLIHKIIWIFVNFFPLKTFAIYRSFGVSSFFYPRLDNNIKKKVLSVYKKKIIKICSIKDLIELKVDNILIGDLVYN